MYRVNSVIRNTRTGSPFIVISNEGTRVQLQILHPHEGYNQSGEKFFQSATSVDEMYDLDPVLTYQLAAGTLHEAKTDWSRNA